MILLGILMQRPQHCVLGANGLQDRGASHKAVQFLLLLLVSLRSLLEGFHTVIHLVLVGASLATEPWYEA